jgi:sulfur-oxidizing protein SoxX
VTKAEVSYGTVGPTLLGYGKLRNFAEADVKAVYEKHYNSNAAFACSLMPRFGANSVLTIDQIKDLVALLMSPDSPVNK